MNETTLCGMTQVKPEKYVQLHLMRRTRVPRVYHVHWGKKCRAFIRRYKLHKLDVLYSNVTSFHGYCYSIICDAKRLR